MFGIPLYKLLTWKEWLKLAVIVLAVISFIVLFALALKGCDGTTDKAIEMDSERIERELAEARKRSEAIDAELYDLRAELEEIRNEIAESVRAREEMHDAIDDAVTIDDINDLLRKRRR